MDISALFPFPLSLIPPPVLDILLPLILHAAILPPVSNAFEPVICPLDFSLKLLPLSFDKRQKSTVDRLYEPSKEELIESLIPRHLNVQMWKFLLESYASEQAARMLSMENATTNAQDMIKNLTLEFNKARQAAITTEMLEIVGGAEALG